MIKIANFLVGLLLFTLVFSGCVSMDSSKKGTVQKNAALVEQYIAKGESFEAKNNLTSALEQYKLALSLDPANEKASKHRDILEKVLKQRAQDHYKAGLNYDKAGRHDLARKEFLAALQNWPEHGGAKKMMTPGRVQTSESYVLHTIMPGESISKLAIIYYGDYRNYPLISRFNHLENATLVTVGQQVKVPAIEGISIEELNRVKKTYMEALKLSGGSEYPEAGKPMAKAAAGEKAAAEGMIREKAAPGDVPMAETTLKAASVEPSIPREGVQDSQLPAPPP